MTTDATDTPPTADEMLVSELVLAAIQWGAASMMPVMESHKVLMDELKSAMEHKEALVKRLIKALADRAGVSRDWPPVRES